MKRKTIKSLMSKKRVVYIKLTSGRATKAFFALAEYQGFTVSQELIETCNFGNCFIRLNEDMSLSSPTYRSFAGAMQFHNAKRENGKKVIKINAEKLL